MLLTKQLHQSLVVQAIVYGSGVGHAERDAGERSGLASDEKVRLKALERENRELRQTNEILKKASAYFAAAELDRPFRKW